MPWAHRSLIFRSLKALQDHIDISVVNPEIGKEDWHFDKFSGSTQDRANHQDFLYQVYIKSDAKFSGIVTIPVLWVKKTQQIVNNDSSEIIQIFNSAFNHITNNHLNFYPQGIKRPSIL